MGKVEEGVNISAVDEIAALQELRHPNIITLHEVCMRNNRNILLVFDFMETDLCAIIAHSDPRKTPFVPLTDQDAKGYMGMMLRGVEACHARHFIHRDLKPGNLLIGSDGTLKLADFGLARTYGAGFEADKYSPQAFTRWYKPPELLLSVYDSYGPETDMWSVGCILAELYIRKPLFAGENEISQINLIVDLLGSPNTSNWPGFSDQHLGITFNDAPAHPLGESIPSAPACAIDLVGRLVRYGGVCRMTAGEALQHEYFSSVPPPSTTAEIAQRVEIIAVSKAETRNA
eukprot:CAMPEP_0206218770 /NCGR_PEP_ID=MMETSP0047_2-20121206/3971_1 /ASSEMBLY_ACC=CAM_ASM_000192 /TAXON_ID=195065 /ORGANISM="Chroomonas mesostigmatica_cf, Strain CCMP1168" /LENGTH=287 /DNA_ID=CAMNT_0053641285 /DNA_START=51 /DNA_END=910 /DNA_ORIENTATION=+